MPEHTCALCGRKMDHLESSVSFNRTLVIPLCHPADAVDPMTCYHRWTVYGERPTEEWAKIAQGGEHG